jgi:Kef-type K+ transport system membrane component KefB
VVALGKLIGLAVLFLVGGVALGLKATPILLHWARRMRSHAAVPAAALIFCLVLASVAEMVKLAPIVGAFAAGLVLSRTQHKVHFEERLRSIAELFVPVFFVMMGARMSLSALSPGTPQGRAALLAGGLLLAAVVASKVLAGASVPLRGARRWVVGVGMIPRGEVTLIAATLGLQTKVIDEALYAAIIFVVICTTFITPPLLKALVGRRLSPAPRREPSPADSSSRAEAVPVCEG